MGSTQLYSLTWGDFGTSLVSAVQLLRCHGDLVDVTLAAGGRSFPAHKIVLCAASPFLLNLLKSTPCQHPVIMLAGVTAADLEILLEFMYRGEVSVDPNQLPSVLQAAHCLNIQGLAPGTTGVEKPDGMSTAPPSHEAFTREVINSFLPLRRRKRVKSRSSTGSGGKWPRHDSISSDGEGRSLDHHSSDHHALQLQDVSHKSEGESSSMSAEESAPMYACRGNSPSVSEPKIRGASDQPGYCPMCGLMVRQARNLRRHLLTSCRYRALNIANEPPSAIPGCSQVLVEPDIQPGPEVPNMRGCNQVLVEPDIQPYASEVDASHLSIPQPVPTVPQCGTNRDFCEQVYKRSPLPSPSPSCNKELPPPPPPPTQINQ